jgi:hypothetical protein
MGTYKNKILPQAKIWMNFKTIYWVINKGDFMNKSNEKKIERRQSFRLDMEKELIDIAWQDEKGIHKNKKIACFDFSRGGLKIDCDEPIPVSVVVTVIFQAAAPKSQILKGKVLRCLRQKNGWFEIGLLLETSDKSLN